MRLAVLGPVGIFTLAEHLCIIVYSSRGGILVALAML
jgi:hypothetical protein